MRLRGTAKRVSECDEKEWSPHGRTRIIKIDSLDLVAALRLRVALLKHTRDTPATLQPYLG